MRANNYEFFLARAIQSVLNQTYSHWRLVVVCSTENKHPLLKQLEPFQAKLANRLLVIPSHKNNTPGALLNLGIQATDSEFIAIHDVQNSWEPTFLATCIQEIENENFMACATMVYQVQEHLDSGTLIETKREIYNEWQNRSISLFRLAESNTIASIGLVFRRKVIELVGKRREDLGALEDWEFNLRLASRYPITLISKVLASTHNGAIEEAKEDQAKLDIEIRNELLRDDLASGQLGLGLVACMGQMHGQMYQKIHALQNDIRGLSNGSD